MASGFSVTISAVDQFTATINKFNKSIATATAPITRLGTALGKMSDVTGISKLSAGITGTAKAMQGMLRQAESVIAPLGAITGAASIAGVYKLAESFADFGTRLGITAGLIGTTADSLHGTMNAFRLAGVSGDAAASSMLNLSQAITDSVGGQNQQALGYFRQLGIEIRNADGSLRSAKQIMPQIADALHRISNPALRRRVGSAFGLSDDIIAIASRGSAALAQYERDAARHGLINDEGVAAADRMRQAFAGVTQAGEGLGYAIAQKLSPYLTPMLNDLSAWVDKHRTDIADAIGKIAAEIKAWVDDGGIGKLTKSIGEMATKINATVEAFGGWGVALTAFGTILTVNALAPVISLIAKLGVLTAIRLPLWVATLLGVPTAALSAVTLGSGAAAGGMNVPMVDDNGNVIGNWGGADGERNARRNAPGYRGPGDRDNDPNFSDHAQFVPLGTRIWNWMMGNRDAHEGRAGIYPGQGTQGVGPERNIRNNNPTNLMFAGQPGAVSDGRFARFPNMETGVAADLNQYLLYQDRDHLNSIEAMIRRATPASENPGVEDYINRVAAALHVGRSDAINLHDPAMASRFIMAVAPNEGGTPNQAAVDAGVRLRLGLPVAGPYTPPPTAPAPPPAAPGAPGAAGNAKVEVTVRGLPAGSSVNTTTSGGLQATARIESPALLGAYP